MSGIIRAGSINHMAEWHGRPRSTRSHPHPTGLDLERGLFAWSDQGDLFSRSDAFAPVAQWIEHRFPKPRVAGSIPAGGNLTKLEEPNQTALFQTSLPSSPMCFFRKSLMPPHPASPPPLRLWTLLPDVIRSSSLLKFSRISPAFSRNCVEKGVSPSAGQASLPLEYALDTTQNTTLQRDATTGVDFDGTGDSGRLHHSL